MSFHIPGPPLADFVEYIAYIHGYESGNGIAFQRMNQVIIINMGDCFSVSDVYAPSAAPGAVSDTVWINGKQEWPFMLINKGVTAMYAIGIKLGMLPYFADIPAIATNDQAVSAEHWTSKEIFDLRERLFETPQAAFTFIERFLLNLISRRDLSNLRRIKWIGQALHTHSVGDICRTLGFTRKRLSTEARHYFGDPVKNIQGIVRFNQVLSRIAHDSHRTLSGLHDYYDQSHFINDFKARAGITPLQYRRLCQRFPAIRETPNFIPLERETFLQFIS